MSEAQGGAGGERGGSDPTTGGRRPGNMSVEIEEGADTIISSQGRCEGDSSDVGFIFRQVRSIDRGQRL